jgi:hypothetical protein
MSFSKTPTRFLKPCRITLFIYKVFEIWQETFATPARSFYDLVGVDNLISFSKIPTRFLKPCRITLLINKGF